MSAHDRSGQPPARVSLLRARSRLESRGLVEQDRVSVHVARSWERCLSAGLDPLIKPENLVVESPTFARILRQHSVLRSLARPELELLFRQVSGSNYMLALGSPEGVVTDVLADRSFADTEAGRTIIEGSIWSEELRGTNAMGLVLHDQAARSVWRGEHFFRSQEGVSCIAAPIFDSRGTISGVLDASTGSEDWHPHTAALLNMAAANIEAGLFHFEQDARTILRVHPRPEYLSTMSAGLIALDSDGQIVAISRRTREILRWETLHPPGDLGTLFNETQSDVLSRLPATAPVACSLRAGGTVFISCTHFRIRRPKPVLTPKPQPVRQARTGADRMPASRGMVVEDPDLRNQLSALERVIRSCVPVMLKGASGVGKTTLARHIHRLSGRNGDFVVVRCAGIAEEDTLTRLLGSDWKDSSGSRPQGLIERAQGGTLFLDGVDELPDPAQGALLRVIDEYEPVETASGGASGDPQIISACGEHGSTDVEALSLRQDLYYRLNGYSVVLPPLRLRQDLHALADFLLADIAPKHRLDSDGREVLLAHDWPGNIRELRTTLAIAAALAEEPLIRKQDLLSAMRNAHYGANAMIDLPQQRPAPCCSCRQSPLRRDRCIDIREAYLLQNGNASRTARLLGIARSTVYQHIKGIVS